MFNRSNLSKLTSRRAGVDKRISKAEWRLANDELANTVHLSEMVDKLTAESAKLTAEIGRETQAAERQALRRTLVANCR